MRYLNLLNYCVIIDLFFHSAMFRSLFILFILVATVKCEIRLRQHVSCWYVINCDITVYPKKYAHGFFFAVLCCGYTLTDFPISIRLTSLALWQSNDCPSASKATLMNMDKYTMWIHYERLHNHNKAKHNKTVCIFLGIYCKRKQLHSAGDTMASNIVFLQYHKTFTFHYTLELQVHISFVTYLWYSRT